MEGWIKLHRKIMEWEWYSNPNMFRLFVHLILNANREDGTWRGIDIKKGQFYTSINHLSRDLKVSEKVIRGCLLRLAEGKIIVQKGTNKGTILTICKYEDYQNEGRADGQTKGEQRASRGNPNKKKEVKKLLLNELKVTEFPEINPIFYDSAIAFQKLFAKNLSEAGASTKNVDNAKGTWINEIRLMIEEDKYTINDLRDAYSYLQKNVFWKKNILSVPKLREQMHKLKLEMKNGTNRSISKEGTSWDELAGIVAEAFNK